MLTHDQLVLVGLIVFRKAKASSLNRLDVCEAMVRPLDLDRDLLASLLLPPDEAMVAAAIIVKPLS